MPEVAIIREEKALKNGNLITSYCCYLSFIPCISNICVNVNLARPVKMHMDLNTNLENVGRRFPWLARYEVSKPTYSFQLISFRIFSVTANAEREVISQNLYQYVRTKNAANVLWLL